MKVCERTLREKLNVLSSVSIGLAGKPDNYITANRCIGSIPTDKADDLFIFATGLRPTHSSQNRVACMLQWKMEVRSKTQTRRH